MKIDRNLIEKKKNAEASHIKGADKGTANTVC